MDPRAPEPGAARLRILVVAESLPHPGVKGGDRRTWQNVNALARIADVGVFGLCSNDARRASSPDLPLLCWTASSDPALTSPPPKGVRLTARAWLLDDEGHPSDLHYSEPAERELTAMLERLEIDVVVAEGLWVHRYLDAMRSRARRLILDCHNVEAAVYDELARTTVGTGLDMRVVRDVLPGRTAGIEARAVAAADQLWVCSDEDESRLRRRYSPDAPVVVVPNTIRPDDHVWTEPRRARRPTLVYPGILSYPPNAAAARFLVEDLLPLLTAVNGEEWRLLVVGPMPPAGLCAAAERDPRIVVTGTVPDVRPLLAEATVMPVPLLHGGGTRLKVLEAFAAGVPVVSTTKGVEGLDVQDGVHLLLAEDAPSFSRAVGTLARDRRLALRLTRNARALVEARYSWEAAAARICEGLSRVAA